MDSRQTEIVAPPLTFESVFEVLRGLRSKWISLGHRLGVYRKVEEIQRQHRSDEVACLKALIEAFLRGEGFQPSWRRVIDVLYHVGGTRIAQDIISYAEPVEGEGVCGALEGVAPHLMLVGTYRSYSNTT